MNQPYPSMPIVAPWEQLNFVHQDDQLINKNITASQAYCLMTNHTSWWLKIAFKIRDFLSYTFGKIQPIKGFGSASKTFRVGEKLDFFDIIKISGDELFLQATDKHLSVLVAIQIIEHSEIQNKLIISTSVITYNLFGKIYMLPVAKVHSIIVKNMLKKTANQ